MCNRSQQPRKYAGVLLRVLDRFSKDRQLLIRKTEHKLGLPLGVLFAKLSFRQSIKPWLQSNLRAGMR